MGPGARRLWGFMLVLLIVSGCATQKPSTIPIRTPPPPTAQAPALALPPAAGSQEKKEMPITKAAPTAPSPSSCEKSSLSRGRLAVSFLMEGSATLGKNVPLDAVLKQARADAIARVYQCSGTEQMLKRFYDRTNRLDPTDENRVLNEIRSGLGIDLSVHTVKIACQEEGERRTCQDVIMGRLTTVRPDPHFRIHSSGIGTFGTLSSGGPVSVRFSLTQPANVYLFDLEEGNRGTLLFPNPYSGGLANPLRKGAPIEIPSPKGGVKMVAALRKGEKKRLGHLWIVALRNQSLFSDQEIQGRQSHTGDLLQIRNFRKEVLERLRSLSSTATPWSLRVIPYVIRKDPPPGSPVTRSGNRL